MAKKVKVRLDGYLELFDQLIVTMTEEEFEEFQERWMAGQDFRDEDIPGFEFGELINCASFELESWEEIVK